MISILHRYTPQTQTYHTEHITDTHMTPSHPTGTHAHTQTHNRAASALVANTSTQQTHTPQTTPQGHTCSHIHTQTHMHFHTDMEQAHKYDPPTYTTHIDMLPHTWGYPDTQTDTGICFRHTSLRPLSDPVCIFWGSCPRSSYSESPPPLPHLPSLTFLNLA